MHRGAPRRLKIGLFSREQVLRIQKVIEGSSYEELIQQFYGWDCTSFGKALDEIKIAIPVAWLYYVARG
ncbi:hypothetical protein HKBW3S44_01058, partial [Candidatus Hakubella thermalkaliphila]